MVGFSFYGCLQTKYHTQQVARCRRKITYIVIQSPAKQPNKVCLQMTQLALATAWNVRRVTQVNESAHLSSVGN